MAAVKREISDYSEHYDQEDDVYYVSFKTDEPSSVRETEDDNVLIEVGIYSQMPTGFRILNYKKAQISGIKFVAVKMDDLVKSAEARFKSNLTDRENRVKHALEKVFA